MGSEKNILRTGNTSLRDKLLLSFSLLIFIPLLITGIISYEKSRKVLVEEVTSSIMATMDQATDRFDVLIRDLETVTKFFRDDKNVIGEIELLSLVGSQNIAQERINRAVQQLEEQIVEIEETREDIDQIGVHLLNGVEVLLISGVDVTDASFKMNDGETKKKAVEYETVLGNKEVTVIPTHKGINKNGQPVYEFSILRKLVNSSGRYVGAVKMDINESTLEALYKKINLKKNGYAFIIDKNDRYISHLGDHDTLGTEEREIPKEKLEIVHKEKQGYFEETLEGKKALVAYSNSEITDWKVIGVMFEDELTSEIGSIGTGILIVGLICTIIAVIIAVILALRMSKPIDMLVEISQNVSKGNLDCGP